MRYRVYTEPGLESLLADELQQLGIEQQSEAPAGGGWVDLHDHDSERLSRSRIARRALRHVASGNAQELSSMRAAIAQLEIPELYQAASFRVSATVRRSELDRNEAAGTAGGALQERHRCAVDLTGFEVELCLMIDGSSWMLGLPTDRVDRTKRVLRPLALRTALRPTVAAALIQLAGANQGAGRLVDPLCGAATIPIEARRWNPLLTVDAFDWDEATLNVARKTLEANKVDSVELQLLDARELGRRFPQRYDYIITDPPYGVRQARRGGVAKLYRGLLDSFAVALKPTGRVALIVVKRETLQQAAEASGWKLVREVELELGAMQATLILLQREHESVANSELAASVSKV